MSHDMQRFLLAAALITIALLVGRVIDENEKSSQAVPEPPLD